MSLSADRSRDVTPPDDDEDRPFPMVAAIGLGLISGAVLVGIPFALAVWPLWR